MTTHTAWITVGHETTHPTPWTTSTSDEPRWADRFDADVREAVTRDGLAAIVTEVGTEGKWDGVDETGHGFLVAFGTDPFLTPASKWAIRPEDIIRGRLAHLCWKYGQDAIGFVGTCGGETLVTP